MSYFRFQLQHAKVFLGYPASNKLCCNAALRAVGENNLRPFHLFHSILAVVQWYHFKSILNSGSTYFPWVCTEATVLCLSSFPKPGFGSVLRCVCGQWTHVLKKKKKTTHTPWDNIEGGFIFVLFSYFFQKQSLFCKFQLVKTWLIPRDHLSETTHMHGLVWFPARTENWRHSVEAGFGECFWRSLVQGELSARLAVIFKSFQTWRLLCYLLFTSRSTGKANRAAVLQRLIKKLSGGVRNPVHVTL